jgi:hypothetical protein
MPTHQGAELPLAKDLEERLGNEGQGDEHEVPRFPEHLEESRPCLVHFQTRIIPSSKATCSYSFGRKIGENGKLKGRKKGPAYKKGTDGFMQYAEGLQADIADLMQGLL